MAQAGGSPDLATLDMPHNLLGFSYDVDTELGHSADPLSCVPWGGQETLIAQSGTTSALWCCNRRDWCDNTRWSNCYNYIHQVQSRADVVGFPLPVEEIG
jgi:hypothetical protein